MTHAAAAESRKEAHSRRVVQPAACPRHLRERAQLWGLCVGVRLVVNVDHVTGQGQGLLSTQGALSVCGWQKWTL